MDTDPATDFTPAERAILDAARADLDSRYGARLDAVSASHNEMAAAARSLREQQAEDFARRIAVPAPAAKPLTEIPAVPAVMKHYSLSRPTDVAQLQTDHGRGAAAKLFEVEKGLAEALDVAQRGAESARRHLQYVPEERERQAVERCAAAVDLLHREAAKAHGLAELAANLDKTIDDRLAARERAMPPAQAALEATIQETLQSLGLSERNAMLLRAAEAGDVAVLSAVARWPATFDVDATAVSGSVVDLTTRPALVSRLRQVVGGPEAVAVAEVRRIGRATAEAVSHAVGALEKVAGTNVAATKQPFQVLRGLLAEAFGDGRRDDGKHALAAHRSRTRTS